MIRLRYHIYVDGETMAVEYRVEERVLWSEWAFR